MEQRGSLVGTEAPAARFKMPHLLWCMSCGPGKPIPRLCGGRAQPASSDSVCGLLQEKPGAGGSAWALEAVPGPLLPLWEGSLPWAEGEDVGTLALFISHLGKRHVQVAACSRLRPLWPSCTSPPTHPGGVGLASWEGSPGLP